MSIRFFVPGKPQGKGRGRVIRINGHGAIKTPEKTVAYEFLVAHAAGLAMDGAALIDGPCAVSLDIACQIPASWPKRRQLAAVEGRERVTTKPDVDNVLKSVLDGMNGVVWRDDVQVVMLTAHKRYARTPGVTVEVSAL